jgi:hypothetical protein
LKPENTASRKKRKTNAAYLPSFVSTKVDLTNGIDEGEKKEYFFTSSKPFRSSRLISQKHLNQKPTTKSVVNFIVNHEGNFLRELEDNGANRISILEAYTTFRFIKTSDSNTTTSSTMGSKLTTNKTGMYLCFFSIPQFKTFEINLF